MYIRVNFAETCEVTEDIQYIDDIIVGDISEDEAMVQAENILSVLGIDKNDIELTIEPYWKVEKCYDVNVCCDREVSIDKESLLKIADIWHFGEEFTLSSWSIPGNKMRYKLTFINLLCY